VTRLYLEKTATARSCAPVRNRRWCRCSARHPQLFTGAFALGAYPRYRRALTAPIRGLSPGMGVDMLGIAFVVVALGGLGNLLGAIAAGLLIGVAQAIVAAHWTEASSVVIYAVMAAVLLVRPQGLFGIR
jgi:branched-chain amino acid transport system permease protein